MMKIAVVGAGNVGGAIGSGWSRAGHAVTYLVRDTGDPALAKLTAAPGAKATTDRAEAGMCDVIALALPWAVAEPAVKALGDLSGKIVIDCMNPLAMRDGALGLAVGFNTSAAEMVAQWLPGARIVKTLNQVGAEVMADASGFSQPPVMFVAGDDDGAKSVVSGLVSELGFETLDAGLLVMARLLEPFGMVWINQALARGAGRDWAFGALRRN
jgi:predicted dinucleotide-binding enzyme